MSKTKSYLQYIVRFKRNSVFISTLVILTALTLFIVGTFYIYANSQFNEHMKDKLYQSTSSSLVNTSNSLDSALSQTLVKTTSFMKTKDVIEATVAPSMLNYTINKSVMEQISAIIQSDDLVREFYYYIPSNETIYASENGLPSYIDFFSFDNRKIVEAYLDSSASEAALGRDLKAHVQMVNDALYLYYEFPVTNLLGLAIIQLDQDTLTQFLYDADTAPDQRILIYDQAGNAVLRRAMWYPQLSVPLGLAPHSISTWQRGDTTYYMYIAPSTGWHYVYTIPQSSSPLKEGMRLRSLIPFLFLLIAASLFCSLLITGKIYRPIHHLLLNITNHMDAFGSERIDAQNEFEYFENAYVDIVKKARWFMELTSNMTPAILERMFDNILRDKCPDDSYVERTLESVGYPFHVDGHCVAIIGDVQLENGVLVTEKERRGCWDSVSETIENAMEGHRIFAYTDRDNRYICIIQFDESVERTGIDRKITGMMSSVNNVLQQQPFTVLAASGSSCTNLKDIGLSCREAWEGLKNISGLHAAEQRQPAGKRGAETAIAVHLPIQAQIKQRVSYLIQTATEGNREKAENFAVRMIKDLIALVQSGEDMDHYIFLFTEEMADHLAYMNIDDRSLVNLQGKLTACLQNTEDLDRLERHMTVFCMRVLEALETSSNRMSLRHIQKVREFVGEHYADNTLSLHMISEHIGLSPSYLSRLVNEHLKQGFNSYVNRIRVERAKEMLYRTSLSSTAVCQQTGFSSVQNFNRVFKRHTGMTPGEYRTKKLEVYSKERDETIAGSGDAI